jgi:hypothetical protein
MRWSIDVQNVRLMEVKNTEKGDRKKWVRREPVSHTRKTRISSNGL